MKILYDHQVFSFQKYGGVSRYFSMILKGFSAKLPLVISDNYYIKNNKKLNFFYFSAKFKGKIRLFSLLNELYVKYYLLFYNYDIFHPTYYNPYFLKFLKNKPFVLTIHDMIHEKYLEMLPPNDNTPIWKNKLAQKASRIIAVSEQTKKDIVEILKINPEKIDVIYHGCSFNEIEICNDFSSKLVNDFVLFTGKRTGYKNFKNFILAIKPILNEDRELFVICAGGGKFTEKELLTFSELEIDSQMLNYQCNDEELKTLYVRSVFFVFPSIYEGFGIPLLEAMASETAILCSNTSCFPEIVADSAILFNPFDICDIREKIKLGLSTDLSYYKEKGLIRLKYFTWEKALEETRVVYNKIYNI